MPMSEKTEAGTQINRAAQVEARQDMQVMMHRLQALDGRISELVCQCEELRKTAPKNKGKRNLCSQCGNEIEDGQEAVIRNMVGTETGRYHRDCLQGLLKWRDP
jgi:uncharacterized protein with PIN domain